MFHNCFDPLVGYQPLRVAKTHWQLEDLVKRRDINLKQGASAHEIDSGCDHRGNSDCVMSRDASSG